MRILHINGNYICSALHQIMVEHLDQVHIESQVVVPSNGKEIPVVEMNKNVKIINCYNDYDRYFFYYKQRKIRYAIENSISINSFDCIHAYTLFTDGYTAMKLSQKYNIPYVVAVRNTDLNIFMKYMPWLRKCGIKVLRNASRVFLLSKSYYDNLMYTYVPKKYRKAIAEKCEIIPNGIDDFWFNNLRYEINLKKNDRIKRNKINIVYAGRINRNKNIPTAQKAIQILREKGYDIQYTIVGKVDDNEEYQAIRANGNAIYIEAQPKEKLCQIYRENDIFVMPSFTETFGLVYAEALSQGLPVIYTRGQGFDKQFDDGIVGYSVDCNNPKDVANKIIKIIKEYSCISANSIKMVEKFKWNKIAVQYKDIYSNIVSTEDMEKI